MGAGRVEHFLQNKRAFWVVGALTIILFLVTNFPWQLDDYDQAKHAFTSFEMVKEGHWFYQQTPHEGVATKPPLVGWTSAVFFALMGCRVAVAVISCGDRDIDFVISRCAGCLLCRRRFNCPERI
jgi:4-amino-4-deoxy-L-arabinose transferase-like glycosyltransferase